MSAGNRIAAPPVRGKPEREARWLQSVKAALDRTRRTLYSSGKGDSVNGPVDIFSPILSVTFDRNILINPGSSISYEAIIRSDMPTTDDVVCSCAQRIYYYSYPVSSGGILHLKGTLWMDKVSTKRVDHRALAFTNGQGYLAPYTYLEPLFSGEMAAAPLPFKIYANMVSPANFVRIEHFRAEFVPA